MAALQTEAAAANQQTPIFMAHGTADSVVAYQAGKIAFEGLKTMAYPVKWFSYPMDHGVCGEEITDIADFIQAIFP